MGDLLGDRRSAPRRRGSTARPGRPCGAAPREGPRRVAGRNRDRPDARAARGCCQPRAASCRPWTPPSRGRGSGTGGARRLGSVARGWGPHAGDAGLRPVRRHRPGRGPCGPLCRVVARGDCMDDGAARAPVGRLRLAEDPAVRVAASGEEVAPPASTPASGNPEGVRRRLAALADSAPLTDLHHLLEEVRERQRGAADVQGQTAWLAVRAAVHQALAARGSTVALYDLREVLEQLGTPPPVALVGALAVVGDATCLEALASAWDHVDDDWTREQLRAAAWPRSRERHGLTGRHAAVKRLGPGPRTGRGGRRRARAGTGARGRRESRRQRGSVGLGEIRRRRGRLPALHARRPSAGGATNGMLRIVAWVSALICASHAAEPHHGDDHEPGPALHQRARTRPSVGALVVRSSRNASARASRPAWMVSSSRLHVRRQVRPSASSAFSRVSRRARTHRLLLDVLRPDLQPQRARRASPTRRTSSPACRRRGRRASRGRPRPPAASRISRAFGSTVSCQLPAGNGHDHHLVGRHLRRQDRARCRRRGS